MLLLLGVMVRARLEDSPSPKSLPDGPRSCCLNDRRDPTKRMCFETACGPPNERRFRRKTVVKDSGAICSRRRERGERGKSRSRSWLPSRVRLTSRMLFSMISKSERPTAALHRVTFFFFPSLPTLVRITG